MQYNELCSRHSEVHLSHTYCETNNAVDYLANLRHFFPCCMHIFYSPYWGLSHWLRYDFIGVFLSILVRISNHI
ncbi:hypothetical protein LINGRAHAP2_LOCUS5843 [Linum grandiflorum]